MCATWLVKGGDTTPYTSGTGFGAWTRRTRTSLVARPDCWAARCDETSNDVKALVDVTYTLYSGIRFYSLGNRLLDAKHDDSDSACVVSRRVLTWLLSCSIVYITFYMCLGKRDAMLLAQPVGTKLGLTLSGVAGEYWLCRARWCVTGGAALQPSWYVPGEPVWGWAHSIVPVFSNMYEYVQICLSIRYLESTWKST